MKKKILYITPHLSTGGLPKFLQRKIEHLINELEIFVVEWTNISNDFIIQKNAIKQLVGSKFYTLNEDKTELFKIIEKINPDIVHLEEVPEMFMEYSIAAQLYNTQRKYLIFETTHTADFDPANKVLFPDKFLFVCEFSRLQYINIPVPAEVIEYPINPKTKNKTKTQTLLGLDPDWKHVVIVGLFTPRKNQGYAIQLARHLLDKKIMFHFVGNRAENFKHYWAPLVDNLPSNCVLWGERADVDRFLEAGDLSLFPSEGRTGDKELNPLIIKESLENDIPLLMYNLDVYLEKYNKHPKISFLSGNPAKDVALINSILNLENQPPIQNLILDNYITVWFQPSQNKVYINSQYSQTLFFDWCVIKELDSDIPIYFWPDITLNSKGEIWCSPINGYDFTNDPFCRGFTVEFYDKNKSLVFKKSVRTKPQIPRTRLPNLSPFECAYINYREFFDVGVYENCDISYEDLKTVIDVGANIGLFSKYIALKKAEKIYALEPIEKAHKNLEKLCSDDHSVIPMNLALDVVSGTKDIYFTNENTTISRFINDFPSLESNYNYGKTNVTTISWKDLIRILEIKEVSLLKIDIEGHEYAIFEAFDSYDLSQIKQIILEFHFNGQHQLDKVIKKLLDNNFKLSFRKQSSQEPITAQAAEGILFAVKN